MDHRPVDHVPSIFSIGLSLLFVWLLLFFALVRSNVTLAVPSAAVLTLMYGTRLWTRVATLRLELVLAPDRIRLFPDEQVRVTATLYNRKPLPVWVRVDVDTSPGLAEADPTGGETKLSAYDQRTRTWSLVAKRRGVAVVGPARLTVGDPFGLHRQSGKGSSRHEVIVFPRIRTMRPLQIPFQEYFGLHASKGPVDDPAWYAGTRDYQGNRPARNIHWKASARLGVLQEKLYEPTSHRKVLFVLDLEGFGGNGVDPGSNTTIPSLAELETSIEAVASMAANLMESGASFGIVTNGCVTGGCAQILPMGRGPEHLGSVLEILARIEPDRSGSLADLIRAAAAGAAGVVYVGAHPCDRVQRVFASLAPRRRRLLFVFAAESGATPVGWSEPPDRLSGQLWNGFPAFLTTEVIDVG